MRFEPGDTFLDVGANVGWFSLLAGDRFARAVSGHVFAVEANPALVAHLGASIVDSGLSAFVTLKPYAISDRVGLAELSADEFGNLGGHNIAPVEPGPRHVIPCLRLDDLFGELPRCDLIKLDIEGAEPLAIRGATALLERHRPKVIMELNRDALTAVAGVSVSATIELMTALGYRPFAFTDGPPRPVSAAEVDERVGLHGYWDVLLHALTLGIQPLVGGPDVRAVVRLVRVVRLAPTALTSCSSVGCGVLRELRVHPGAHHRPGQRGAAGGGRDRVHARADVAGHRVDREPLPRGAVLAPVPRCADVGGQRAGAEPEPVGPGSPPPPACGLLVLAASSPCLVSIVCLSSTALNIVRTFSSVRPVGVIRACWSLMKSSGVVPASAAVLMA